MKWCITQRRILPRPTKRKKYLSLNRYYIKHIYVEGRGKYFWTFLGGYATLAVKRGKPSRYWTNRETY